MAGCDVVWSGGRQRLDALLCHGDGKMDAKPSQTPSYIGTLELALLHASSAHIVGDFHVSGVFQIVQPARFKNAILCE